jgi:hypothetical protein
VQAFDRHRGGERIGGTGEQLRRGEDEDGPQPLAARLQAVAHRGVEAGRAGPGGRQKCLDPGLDAREGCRKFN